MIPSRNKPPRGAALSLLLLRVLDIQHDQNSEPKKIFLFVLTLQIMSVNKETALIKESGTSQPVTWGFHDWYGITHCLREESGRNMSARIVLLMNLRNENTHQLRSEIGRTLMVQLRIESGGNMSPVKRSSRNGNTHFLIIESSRIPRELEHVSHDCAAYEMEIRTCW